MSAIDFVKLCKQLKVYPVVIPFDILKKVIVKAPEYWHTPGKGGLSISHLSNGGVGQSSAGMSEMVTTVFPFKDFFKAFKIIAKHGFKNNTDDTSATKFTKLTQFLQKQLDNVFRKQAESNGGAIMQPPGFQYMINQQQMAMIQDSDSRSVYSANNVSSSVVYQNQNGLR
jgi:hypothetical protein